MSGPARHPGARRGQAQAPRTLADEMPWWVEKLAVPIVFLVVAALLPFLFDSGSSFIGTCVLALAYTVMALGLNIIVGFAGLLDLGYVAFFAIGAYTMGWLGSGFFSQVGNEEGWHIAVSGFAATLPGIHVNFLLVIVVAIIFTTIAGMFIGLPTLRLRGDYIAIVTLAFGEIIGRSAVNGDEIILADFPIIGGALEDIFGPDQPITAGRQGITPVDKIDLPFVEAVHVARPAAVVLGRARDGGDRAVRELPAARLPARPRVGGAARGRGGRGLDGRAGGQDEAAGLRHGRRVRRRVRRVPGLLQQHGERRPVPVLLLDPDPRHGDPRRPRVDLGHRARRHRPHVHQLRVAPTAQLGAVRHRARLRPERDQLRDLRLPAGDHDDHAATGPAARAKAQDGADGGGGHDRRRPSTRHRHERAPRPTARPSCGRRTSRSSSAA